MNPSYFDDFLSTIENITHQPDVYQFAVFLAKKFDCENIIDIGCGSGDKLKDISSDFQLLGVDYGDNIQRIQRFRRNHPHAICLEHDFGGSELIIQDREFVKQAVVVCSDVIEHLLNPIPLIVTLRDLLRDAPIAVVTTPERDLVRGPNHCGPPENLHHVREWSSEEFQTLFRAAGLNIEFSGLTANNNRDWAKRTIMTILSRYGIESKVSAPSDFRVMAFICAYNEEDIIEATLRHLACQGVDTHLIDNWSTDRTVERAEAFLGRGLSRITKFPPDRPSSTYDWYALLSHVESLSHCSGADWCLHYDADEIRESPWPQVRLRDAFFRVDCQGFNAIDHTCIVFHPTLEQREKPTTLESYRWFEFGKRGGHFQQVKAWKRQDTKVRLADSGGHKAEFPGRRIYPFKFLLKHYPVRSQSHGTRKILAERQPRWNIEEREKRGWHVQYDGIRSNSSFLRSPSDLLEFDSHSFYCAYLVERLSGIGATRS